MNIFNVIKILVIKLKRIYGIISLKHVFYASLIVGITLIMLYLCLLIWLVFHPYRPLELRSYSKDEAKQKNIYLCDYKVIGTIINGDTISTPLGLDYAFAEYHQRYKDYEFDSIITSDSMAWISIKLDGIMFNSQNCKSISGVTGGYPSYGSHVDIPLTDTFNFSFKFDKIKIGYILVKENNTFDTNNK